jgi:hypothetical protein
MRASADLALEGYPRVFGGGLVSPGVEVLGFLQHLDNQLFPYSSGMVLAALARDHRTDEGRLSMG